MGFTVKERVLRRVLRRGSENPRTPPCRVRPLRRAPYHEKESERWWQSHDDEGMLPMTRGKKNALELCTEVATNAFRVSPLGFATSLHIFRNVLEKTLFSFIRLWGK